MTFFGVSFLIANCLAFLAVAVDKLLSKWSEKRIPEWVLLLFGLCLGATGAYLAMMLFNHKMQKRAFAIIMGLLVVVQFGYFIWR